MLTSKIKNLIKQGEGLRVEFKKCRAALNKDIFETVCAFLNRFGGELLLGVADDGTVTGIDESIIGHGPISPADFSPFPKNPAIVKTKKKGTELLFWCKCKLCWVEGLNPTFSDVDKRHMFGGRHQMCWVSRAQPNLRN